MLGINWRAFVMCSSTNLQLQRLLIADKTLIPAVLFYWLMCRDAHIATMFCCKGRTCVVHLREINQSLRYERVSFCISRREKVKLNRLTAGVKRLNLLWPRSHFYFMGLLWMKCRPFTAGAVTRQSDAELRKRSRGGKEMREIYEWSLGSTRPRGSEAVRAVPPNTEINQSCAPPPTLGSPPTPSAPSQGCGGRH